MRFRVATLLLIVLAIGVGLGCFVRFDPYLREQRAAETLSNRFDADIYWDSPTSESWPSWWHDHDRRISVIAIEGQTLDAPAVALLAQRRKLFHLVLTECTFTVFTASSLRQVVADAVTIENCTVQFDAGTAWVPEGAVCLDLSATNVHGADLEHLRPDILQQLVLNGTDIDDSAVPSIARCRRLFTLMLSNTGITSACLPQITQLERLEVLDVSETRLQVSDLAELTQSLLLRELRLNGVPCGDVNQLESLLRLPNLRTLHVRDSDFSEAHLMYLLQNHHGLKMVFVSPGVVSADRAIQLREEFGVGIYRW